jgi:threonine synthase
MIRFFCHNCGCPYPPDTTPYICSICGGYYDFQLDLPGVGARLKDYASLEYLTREIGLPDKAEIISLGEGNSPIIEAEVHQRKIYLKLEFTNPTGSFKDRGSAVLATFLKSRGVTFAIEDSSGNAGASFAAYASRAGITCTIFIPGQSGGPKRRQIEAFGAGIKSVPGSRSNAAEAVSEEARKGIVYASHAYMPHVLVGYSSLAFEIVNELGTSPGCVVAPVGQGNLLFAIGKGFQFLKNSGYIEQMPALIGVQAIACAPLWAVSKYGAAGLNLVLERETLAEGVKIKHPIRGDALIQLVEASGGAILAIEEDEIVRGRDELSRLGFYVEPTSALIWDALAQIGDDFRDPIVAILTGSGLKVDF